MRVAIEEIALHRDSRGSVFEPLESQRLPDQRNVHVVLTEPGCIRANHYHRRGTEVLTVHGPALVRYREGGNIAEREVAEGEVVRFTFPPGVAHAVRNIGKKPNLLVAFNTEPHDREQPDVVPEILIDPAEPISKPR